MQPSEAAIRAALSGGPAVDWDDPPGLVEPKGSGMPRPKLPYSFKGLSFLKPRSENFWKGKAKDGSRTMRRWEALHAEPWIGPAGPQGFRGDYRPEAEG